MEEKKSNNLKKLTHAQLAQTLFICKMARNLVDETIFRFTITPAESFQRLVDRYVGSVWSNVLLAYQNADVDTFTAHLEASAGQCACLRYLYSMARYKSYISDEDAIFLIQQSSDYIAEVKSMTKRIEEGKL